MEKLDVQPEAVSVDNPLERIEKDLTAIRLREELEAAKLEQERLDAEARAAVEKARLEEEHRNELFGGWADSENQQSLNDLKNYLDQRAEQPVDRDLYQESLEQQVDLLAGYRSIGPVELVRKRAQAELDDDRTAASDLQEVLDEKIAELVEKTNQTRGDGQSNDSDPEDFWRGLLNKEADRYKQARQQAAAPVTSPQKVAKAEKRTGLEVRVGRAEHAEHGEDVILHDEHLKLFGVFDGMGSGAHPEEAAKAAHDAILLRLDQSDYPSDVVQALSQLKDAFAAAREAVKKMPNDATTACIGRLITIDGHNYWIFANSGDSRMARYNPHDSNLTDQFEFITEDQCLGNRLLNAININFNGSRDRFGFLELKEGDRIMICSDGITRDWDYQFLSDDEMREAFAAGYQQHEPDSSARAFLAASKKNDDKSILILDFLSGSDGWNTVQPPQALPSPAAFPRPGWSGAVAPPPPVPPKIPAQVSLARELLRSDDPEEIELLHELAIAKEAYVISSLAREKSERYAYMTVGEFDADDNIKQSRIEMRTKAAAVEDARMRYEYLRTLTQNRAISRMENEGVGLIERAEAFKADDTQEVLSLNRSFVKNALSTPNIRGPFKQNQARFYDWWARQGGGSSRKERLKGSLKKALAVGVIGLPVGAAAGAVGSVLLGPILGGAAATAVARGVSRGLLRSRVDSRSKSPSSVAEVQYASRAKAQLDHINKIYEKNIPTVTTAKPGRPPISITGVFAEGTRRTVRRNRQRLVGSMAVGALSGWLGSWLFHDLVWGDGRSHTNFSARPSFPSTHSTPATTFPLAPTAPATPVAPVAPSAPVPAAPQAPSAPTPALSSQIHQVALAAGDNPWDVAEDQLENQHIPLTNQTIWNLDQRILQLNKLTVPQSYHLPTGLELEVPNVA